jgi:4-amino-4-deoxy-L-arabinose transferase-like glycosyltransferase
VVLALAFGAQFHDQLLTGYADVPLGLMAAPGVLCLGLWLRELDWRWLALGSLLLAAAASVKNEGVLLVVAVFIAAAIVLAVGREWRPLSRLGLGFVGVALALAPWRIWIAAHDITSNLPISKGLDPSYLSERSGRVGPTLKALLPMLESGGLSYVIPLALTLVVLGVATPGLRRVAAFYLLAGLGTVASVVWAFVITADALDWQIATAGSRVVMGVAFVCVAALLQVGGLLDHSTEPPGGGLDPLARADPGLPAEQPVRLLD